MKRPLDHPCVPALLRDYARRGWPPEAMAQDLSRVLEERITAAAVRIRLAVLAIDIAPREGRGGAAEEVRP